jgi:protein ImuA
LRPAKIPVPEGFETAVWRGDELGTPITATVPSGWTLLDAELPGGGWPCHAITEVLQPQPTVCEWRLLGPALRAVVAGGQAVVMVGPPKHPHLPGLKHEGLDDHHLVWIQAETPAERLWATEQLIKANACGALLSWLPQARPEQLRRLQVAAAACEGPVVLFRPDAAQHEASPAPLRLLATFGVDWELRVHVLKRRGVRHEGTIALPSLPGGLDAVLPPRLRTPSRLLAERVSADALQRADDVLGRTAAGIARRRPLAA